MSAAKKELRLYNKMRKEKHSADMAIVERWEATVGKQYSEALVRDVPSLQPLVGSIQFVPDCHDVVLNHITGMLHFDFLAGLSSGKEFKQLEPCITVE